VIRLALASTSLVVSTAVCNLLALLLLAGCGAVSQPEMASAHSVSLAWNASGSATHYNVYRSEISGGYYRLIGSTQNLNFRDMNVDPGVTFYYVCTAVDSAGRESDFSNEVRASIPPD